MSQKLTKLLSLEAVQASLFWWSLPDRESRRPNSFINQCCKHGLIKFYIGDRSMRRPVYRCDRCGTYYKLTNFILTREGWIRNAKT